MIIFWRFCRGWLVIRSIGKVFREGCCGRFLESCSPQLSFWRGARLLSGQSKGAVYRKSVTLEMSWKRGDDHYGPNFVHLESTCFSSPESRRFCSLDFKTTTSEEFAEYVASFGGNRVPVNFMWTTTEIIKWLEPFRKAWVSGQMSDFISMRGRWV